MEALHLQHLHQELLMLVHFQQTPLISDFFKTNRKKVFELLHKKASTSAQTLFNYASEKNYTALMELCIEHGACLEAKSEEGWTSLLDMAYSGDVYMTERLLGQRVNVNGVPKTPTALLKAAAHNHYNLCATLLDSGADVNATNKVGHSALLEAGMRGYVDIVTLLLDAYADANHANKFGQTVLMKACALGHYSVVETLLSHPYATVSVNSTSRTGYTALMYASEHGHGSIVDLLLRHGADITLTNSHGHNALSLAYKRERRGVISILTKTLTLTPCATLGMIRYERSLSLSSDTAATSPATSPRKGSSGSVGSENGFTTAEESLSD